MVIEMPNRAMWHYCTNCYSTRHTINQCPDMEEEENDD